jgi:hypothetical protein
MSTPTKIVAGDLIGPMSVGPAGDDGTLEFWVGPAGSKVKGLTVDAAGGVAFPLSSILTAALASAVAMNVTSQFFVGPSLSLPAGKWLVVGKVCVSDTSGAASFGAKLTDGTTVFDSSGCTTAGANYIGNMSVNGVITLAVTSTVSVSACNVNSAGASILASSFGGAKASSICAWRVA